MLEAGAKLPDVGAETDAGKPVTLRKLGSGTLVVYFYPRADTPGCTNETLQFRDLYTAFVKKGADVVGVSRDTVAAQAKSQPFVYPSGLVEVPMSPISDVGAFRNGRWKLASFTEAIRRGVQWAIDNGAAYDFLSHPSCLYVTDPEFRTIDMICDMVKKAGDRAEIVGLDALAKRGLNRPAPS